MKRPVWLVALLAFSTLNVSCSGNPDKDKRAYVESGVRYLEQKDLAAAIIEFRNAVRIDAAYGDAHLHLADALLENGDSTNGARSLIRAADLLPDRADIQLRAGNILLLGGQFDAAQLRAEKLLARDPRSVEAQILKAKALAGLLDLEEALAQMQEALALEPGRSASYTALGGVRMARGEASEAETAFERASELDPQSITARLALGQFYWSRNRLREAEEEFLAALKIDGQHPTANRALATFYLASGRAVEAERFLNTVAEDARRGSAKLTLADYYVMLRRYDEAMRILTPLLENPESARDARLRIAGLTYLQKKPTDALLMLDEILEEHVDYPPALLAKGRILLDQGQLESALQLAERAAQRDPGAITAHYLIGSINSALQRPDRAREAFSTVLRLNPRAVAAQVQLAALELSEGRAAISVQHAQDAVATQPQHGGARLVLAKSLMAEGNLLAAERELKTLIATHPDSAVIQSTLGTLYLRRHDVARARERFEAALRLDADALEPVAALAAMDIDAGGKAAVRTRIEARLARSPEDPATMLLAARVFLLLSDKARAHQLLLGTIERAPTNIDAFATLGQLYVSEGRLDEARGRFEKLVAAEPKAVPAQTMLGMIMQIQNQRDAAIKQYRSVLALDPRAAVAANNLAWLEAERGEGLEEALELARTAKEILPGRPEIIDTLAYVYLQKNTPDLAVPILREAIKLDAGNPRYRLRLATALARTGKVQEGRREAGSLWRKFSSLPEAKEALAALGLTTKDLGLPQ